MNDSEIELWGNVGKIGDAQYTPTGKMVLKATLAVNKGRGDDKLTNWYDITLWGERQVQNFKSWVKVGTTLQVKGGFWARPWTNKEGEKNVSLEVNVNSFRVIRGGKSKEESQVEEDGNEDNIPY